MSEIVSQSALDRLQWLVKGKPTPGPFEELGGAFNPQFHFMALLPVPALPASEADKAQAYFDAMFQTLVPVRDLIAAYELRGVMSRTPMSDFSLEVQFSDPYVVDMVRRSLPRELSGSAVATRRHDNATLTQTEASMFFRDKNRQENSAQPSSAPVTTPAPEAAPVPESAAPESAAVESAPIESPLTVVTIAPPPAPVVVAPQPVEAAPFAMPAPVVLPPPPVATAPVAAPSPAREPGRKKMLIPEGITMQGGEIFGCAHLAIEGEAYSTIDRCETLELLPGGIFKGAATVAEAQIAGFCQGTLVVRDTLRITRTGHVVGSIQCGRLVVEDGARIEGELKMALKSSDTASTPSDNPRWVELSQKLSA